MQILVIVFIFAGETIFNHLKIETPEIFKTVSQNKFASFMFVWLVGNTVQSALLSTNAFEIHHGDVKIWSSLEHKRLPNLGDIYTAFKKTGVDFMQMTAESP